MSALAYVGCKTSHSVVESKVVMDSGIERNVVRRGSDKEGEVDVMKAA